MALMVQLEPAPLRRLLKKGLRRGLSTDALRLCLDSDWGFDLESQSASKLLCALRERRWFMQSQDADLLEDVSRSLIHPRFHAADSCLVCR